ncbi:hypothetical protein [Limosilactobacillus reuteri]|uniref:hypothetical protein n=1 Tax=Limosilactobacillus reuteri TaxID=1598 RepID=UPI001E41D49E|nr:hypothetical protein [Limosilactobacillus reuteri]MCC4466426.1 hypothetical protein [Limosilactobacillus reuteri]MCC4474202.1 hypothetical protein [Limosilactobacillus reuteri]
MKQSEELRAKLDELHISAREAYNKSLGNEQYQRIMIDIYDLIRECINMGMVHTDYWIDDYYLAHRALHELGIQGYNVSLEKDDGADKEWRLYIDWSDVDLDPNKKYILPMDDVYSLDCYGNSLTGYAYKGTNGSWFMAVIGTNVNGEDIERLGYTVTAKDLEYAPEWVKVLEPVEVEG